MRYFLSLVSVFWLALGASAGADDRQEDFRPSGYATSEASYQYDVAHDGYGGVGLPAEPAEPTTYVVVESESGTKTEYEGESIIVVKEPDPVAASSQPPPPPRVVPSDEAVLACPSGVWVHGYWDYRGGRYVWIDGHCVALRVNYVFVAPRWDFYWDVWWFIPGYYRPCGVFVTYGYYRPWHWFPPYPYPYYGAGRAISESRGAPARPTVARPVSASRVPAVRRAPRHPTVIQTPPSGATRSLTLGRAGTGPEVTEQGIRSRHGVDVVTEPEYAPRPTTGFGATPSGRSRGFSGRRPRSRPSQSGSGWTPSSDSYESPEGWGGDRSRSAPSTGSSGGRGRGFGGKRK